MSQMVELPQALRALPLPPETGVSGDIDPDTGRRIGQLVTLKKGMNTRQGIDLVLGTDGEPLVVEYERAVPVEIVHSEDELRVWRTSQRTEWINSLGFVSLLMETLNGEPGFSQVYQPPPVKWGWQLRSYRVTPSLVVTWRPDIARPDPVNQGRVVWRWVHDAFAMIPDRCCPGFYETVDGIYKAAHLAVVCEAWLRLDDVEAAAMRLRWRSPAYDGTREQLVYWQGPDADQWYQTHADTWYSESVPVISGLPCSECPYREAVSRRELKVMPP